ncbi:hypothetical protein GIB67_014891 [Kingdonia uniflora]|uniref:AIG1-type G domain-containing protein n=1 Tax=Kingdonia uniflora TaxID=39325 RepID=A0A7J7MTE5_9MAGN|nr:hypothetical protein GIB67_014891 [Kingdonia uniflora]
MSFFSLFFLRRMNAFKDWITSQLASKSILSSTPSGNNRLFEEENLDEEYRIRGSSPAASLTAPSTSFPPSVQENDHPPRQAPVGELPSSHLSQFETDDKMSNPLAKIEALQIKLFRLLQRLGHSIDNLLVSQVLYRLHLASVIRVGESDSKRASLGYDQAKAIAADQEIAGQPDLDFSLRILILGKTGVGKSSTINSVFDQLRVSTDAFQPSTDGIQEIAGIVNGIKIAFIDTPGLLPSSTSNLRVNRKILRSVKKFIRKNPPDIVLYLERLDLINMGYSDLPLLKLITSVFGSAIWFNTVLVMTHSSAFPEGPDGHRISYESFVTQCANLVQHFIHLAISDSKLENRVLLVENHSQCRKNVSGEKILPNGEVWRSQLLLLCICTKVLADASAILKFQDGFQLGPTSGARLPSLPHLLSSFLKPRTVSNTNKNDSELDDILDDVDDEDEYDKLPPIRIQTKIQFEKLTKSQKNEYLGELDYRETLYLKKQWKAESTQRRKDIKVSKDGRSSGDDNYDNQEASPESVLLPDLTIPSSFDSDHPVHRYRCLITSDQWLVRPVLDPQGWDHEAGFDGINLESAVELSNNIHASIVGQINKDKQDFNILSECSATYMDPKWPTLCASLDVQTSGKNLVCTVRGDMKLSKLMNNTTGCGFSVTSFGNNYYVGAKIEDAISIGKRVKLLLNAGRIGGLGQVAYGGSLETTLNGRDYPVRDDKVSLTMSVLSFDKEMVLGGGLQSNFRPFRGTKMSVNGTLNSRRMGKVSVKTSSSERVEIALIGVLSVVRAVLRKRATDD